MRESVCLTWRERRGRKALDPNEIGLYWVFIIHRFKAKILHLQHTSITELYKSLILYLFDYIHLDAQFSVPKFERFR